MSDGFVWPPLWSADLTDERRSELATELLRELPADHVLRGQKFKVLATLKRDRDWIILELDDGRFAATHLTWKVETRSDWPGTELFDSIESLLEPSNWQ